MENIKVKTENYFPQISSFLVAVVRCSFASVLTWCPSCYCSQWPGAMPSSSSSRPSQFWLTVTSRLDNKKRVLLFIVALTFLLNLAVFRFVAKHIRVVQSLRDRNRLAETRQVAMATLLQAL